MYFVLRTVSLLQNAGLNSQILVIFILGREKLVVDTSFQVFFSINSSYLETSAKELQPMPKLQSGIG